MEHEKTPCPSPTCPICSKLKPEPKKLTLKERILKQRNENWESSERIWKKIQEQIKNELALPVEIFHTKRGMDADQADDLQSGDLSKEDILKINPSFNVNDFNKSADVMFRYFEDIASSITFGEYEPVILELIQHMRENSGTTYRSSLLDKAMREHETTIQFSNDISHQISNELKRNNGVLNIKTKELIQSYLMSNSVLPKFDAKQDRFNGMALAIHDVYAVSVVLEKITITGRNFNAILSYKVQDHFGLDKLDVSDLKPFHNFSLFRTWFILQRYNKLGYAPFITEMNFKHEIKGEY